MPPCGMTTTGTWAAAAVEFPLRSVPRPRAKTTIRSVPLKEKRFSMKRKAYGRDAGLSLRMLLTGSLLGLLYVFFALVLFYVFNAGLWLMLVIVLGVAIFQYYTSDKLALAASGAKVVSPEEAPKLHAMVERLSAMADLPKPRVAFVDT